MREILPAVLRWHEEGRRFAFATVTHTWGSSPRPVGSVMAVREDGLILGSVSGGCVETAVIEEAMKVIRTGRAKLLEFGALDDLQFWDVGLSCGGKIKVFVELPEPAELDEIDKALNSDEPIVSIKTLEPVPNRILWKPKVASAPNEEAALALASRQSRESENRQSFIHVLSQRERLLIVGAVHIAVPLICFSKTLGFEIILIDPRETFAQAERFEMQPDRILTTWPEEAFRELGLTQETYAVVLTHDPKIDDVALAMLLKSPARYIGALGSKTTQAKRRRLLAEQGFSEADLNRIHGPVGLSIGARTPEEIALSIMAEIVQVRRSDS